MRCSSCALRPEETARTHVELLSSRRRARPRAKESVEGSAVERCVRRGRNVAENEEGEG